jgi:hypothetical protein
LAADHLFAQLLISTARYFKSSLAEGARKVQALRERYEALEDSREARGIILLREWLSAEQRAQFDATKSFEVIGCDSGKRYRILYGTASNIQELDDAGQPVRAWCFIPSGHLVAGDVMLARGIALETDEEAALKIANEFPVRVPERNRANVLLRRAY